MDYIRVTKENIDREHICCAMSGKQSLAKKEWLKQRFEEGLVFYRSAERGKCFIEYIPAENAWVPIDAAGWLYINCLWVSGSLKGHGYSSELLEECLRDAKAQGKNGVCILCAEGRKRDYLADSKFLTHNVYCADILVQVAAVNAALNGFSKELLSQHVRTCVADDLRAGGTQKLDELLQLLPRLMK